ncbi:hypothetical protein BC936DRAFT_138414 [Jimgerdemannia flammicorona]|uniref:Cysteine-rich transmembrane domain-containing protein n=1 Tax=Jimgerdemannia flammicorona TaxID=994334 RepID=A0A433DIJ2_9FUNG|nr:hypothetical protein BC936DRAFT_138414 [Jimgerdemannia flammicorona]
MAILLPLKRVTVGRAIASKPTVHPRHRAVTINRRTFHPKIARPLRFNPPPQTVIIQQQAPAKNNDDACCWGCLAACCICCALDALC